MNSINLHLQKRVLHGIIERALDEDIGAGDVTTRSILKGFETGIATAYAKSATVIAGTDVFREVFLYVDGGIAFRGFRSDGEAAAPGDIIAEVGGNLGSILMAERVALNLFQRMCGIATFTHRFVEAVKGTSARILDTRKTAPGLRLLDKAAVRTGGGFNHRFGLFDGVLIKDNHIAAAGGIERAVMLARSGIAHTLKIEVEARSIDEVDQALAAGADIIMLDNMGLPAMREAVSKVAGKVPLEASGNVTLENVRQIAETGVDFISVGALTHSAAAADISLRFD
ncbi:MAG: carboxylating nicotinate-nucleotide diphosphorylase [Deltaproteobacteria bacterium]|nr:carboxylating nicotinate-nucleotide diphosphorylase [Deltaproteobacteria bacterium]